MRILMCRAVFQVATIGLFVVQFPFSLEAQQNRSPVFDVHLHGSFTKANTDAMQAMMDSLNVTGAMFIGRYEQITSLPEREPKGTFLD